jgi:hypothetical protein
VNIFQIGRRPDTRSEYSDKKNKHQSAIGEGDGFQVEEGL